MEEEGWSATCSTNAQHHAYVSFLLDARGGRQRHSLGFIFSTTREQAGLFLLSVS